MTESATARVAVVVPAYRCARTLPDTLRSLAAQTEPALEVVVVDDGSPTGDADVARGLAAELPGLRVVEQANAGVGAARNRGLAETRARYVAFVDADDALEPGCLAALADHLDAHPEVSLAYVDTDEIVEDARGDVVLRRSRRPPPEPLHEELLAGAYPCLPSACLQRREAALAVGGFRTRLPIGEDVEYLAELALAGHVFARVPGPKMLYRVRADQRSADPVAARADFLDVLERIAARLPRRAPQRPRLRARLRWLRLAQAAALDERGERAAARRLVLRALTFPPRPGQLVETLRLLPAPRRAALTPRGAGTP